MNKRYNHSIKIFTHTKKGSISVRLTLVFRLFLKKEKKAPFS